jgi:hypothetical protein
MPPLRHRPDAAALAAATLLALSALGAGAARAQTVTTGAIEGVTLAVSGAPLPAVEVTLVHRASGLAHTVVSDGAGVYRSIALPPGRYDLRAERFGFRPLLVLDVTIGAASSVALDLRLRPADPPVTSVDTLAVAEGAVHTSRARGTWDSGRDLVELADPLGGLASLASLASVSAGGLALEGFPDRLGSVGVDGIPWTAAAHPAASRTDLAALAFPFASLHHAEVAPGTDVEWPGYGGALISAFTARAARTLQLRTYAGFQGTGLRGGAIASLPVVQDTASLLVGVDFRRVETTYKAPWASDSLAQRLVAVAQDSFAQDLSGYLRPVTERTDLLVAFGRFDWEVAAGQSVVLRAAVADRSSHDFDLGANRLLGLGSSLQARDISASGAFTSRLATNLHAEVSVAVNRSLRDFGAPALRGTMLVADGLSIGADGALPGRFERNATRASAALLLRSGAHELKAGVATTWTSHDITFAAWQAGTFLYGSVDDFAQGLGSFVQTVGGQQASQFTISSSAVFLQDAWSLRRGLSVIAGVRVERESWPTGGVTASAAWQRLTGLSNATVPGLKARVNPRFGFSWTAGPRSEWLLRGDAGVFSEGVDPAVLAEVLSHDGGVQYRRGVGPLGGWPNVPPSTAAFVTGPALSQLDPTFQAPRTSRVELSIGRDLGAGASLQVRGQYRHTASLPRRTDLNLAASPVQRDQDGRPIYGNLEQFGALLVATPGTNRRFSQFDLVSAIDASGYSDYWGVTTSLGRVRERGLSVWVSYTYSRTTDNWPGAAGSVPEQQLSPFPDVAGTADWRDGRSDLDVPHRAALGGEWAQGHLRLGALVRYRSGAPFTPGFRDGVDINGDGSWGNDPAFVSDTVTGAAAVIAGSSCLRALVGRFAVRNSCRAPAEFGLDLRFAVRDFSLLGIPAELDVDGLNVLTSGEGVVDRALYLVDGSRSLTASGTGVVNVPLVANPNFGKLLVRRSPGAAVRVGLRVSL